MLRIKTIIRYSPELGKTNGSYGGNKHKTKWKASLHCSYIIIHSLFVLYTHSLVPCSFVIHKTNTGNKYSIIYIIGIKIWVYDWMPQSMLSEVPWVVGFRGKRWFDVMRGNMNMDVAPNSMLHLFCKLAVMLVSIFFLTLSMCYNFSHWQVISSHVRQSKNKILKKACPRKGNG